MMEAPVLRIKLADPMAKAPGRMTAGSGGLDLYAAESMVIPPTRCEGDGRAEVGRALVSTGLMIELPRGTVGRIAARSGLSVKCNIEVGAGWIDSDYRGMLMVELKNFSAEPYPVRQGDRIAQLMVLPVVDVQIDVVTDLEVTSRGASGFGSTGC